MARATAQAEEIEGELAKLDGIEGIDARLLELSGELSRLTKLSGELEAELTRAEAAGDEASEGEAKALAAAASARLDAQELQTELATLLKPADARRWRLEPDRRGGQVEPGYEQALGAALGDDLDAASEEAAPAHWLAIGTGDIRSRPSRRRRSP